MSSPARSIWYYARASTKERTERTRLHGENGDHRGRERCSHLLTPADHTAHTGTAMLTPLSMLGGGAVGVDYLLH
jgi:hypothetical protein